MGQVAAAFQVSASWLSIVKNSDAFRDYYDARRAEVQSQVSCNLADKINALAELGVEALTEHLVENANGKDMSPDSLVGITDLALKALGFGAKHADAAPAANTLVVITDREALEAARKKLTAVREQVHDAELAENVEPKDVTEEGEVIEHGENPAPPPVPAPE